MDAIIQGADKGDVRIATSFYAIVRARLAYEMLVRPLSRQVFGQKTEESFRLLMFLA